MAAPKSPYPEEYDNLINPAGSDQLSDVDNPHSLTHGKANNAMEKTQRVIGVRPEGTHADMAERIDAIDTSVEDLEAAIEAAWDIINAKGDLLVGTGPGAGMRQPVGDNGMYIVGDETSPSGIKYVRLAAGDSVIPEGGLSGDVMVKASDDDYDITWITLSGILPGDGGYIAREPYPTGGTVTTYTADGYTYRVHTFDTTGSDDALVVSYAGGGVIGDLLAVGAGGGGGDADVSEEGGGGGSGGVFLDAYAFGTGSHRVRIGAGGAHGADGETTKFDDVWCYGGGHGGNAPNGAGPDGGSGGGGAQDGVGGDATGGSVDAGATLSTRVVGGAGADGTGSVGGAGGSASVTSSISGSSVTYGQGGAVAAGGANGAAGSTPGAGGQAGDNPNHVGGAGHKGIVIVRYRTA